MSDPIISELACEYSLEQLNATTHVWTSSLNASHGVEHIMDQICSALENNCSDKHRDRQDAMRFIRDTIAYDENLSGCKMSDSLSYEIISMVSFWGLLLILQMIQLLVSKFCKVRSSGPKQQPEKLMKCFGRFRVICERLSTPWSWPGKILGLMWSIFSVVSFFFYLYQTHTHYRFLRFCQNEVDRVFAYIDLGFNIFFLVYFFIRYIASANKASFLVAPHSLMEVCTIGPSICTIINEDKHSLFNFLRAIRLAAIKEVLISFNIISAATSKSLISLVIGMFCFWSTLAGLVHLVENLDNFWPFLGPRVFEPCKALNFFNSFYMLIITASTVGYGDIFPRTTLGQLTIMICIVVAGTYFLTSVPAFLSLFVENRKNKKTTFATGIGQRHIVLTGSIEGSTTRAFLNDFYNKGRWDSSANAHIKCCALYSGTLPAVTQWLFHGMTGRVRAIRGSSVNPRQLTDVKAYSANAIIILSRLLPSNRDEDDYDNYMRAMTVKLNFPDVRTIVQIHSIYNKFSYYYLTGWRNKSAYNSLWDLDSVICNDQIVNGLMGINCVAPGFSTLIINLLCSTEARKTDVFQQYKWRSFYNFGLMSSFHCVRFTRSFRGLSFKAACAIIYDRWGIILLGVSVDQASCNYSSNIVNPSGDPNFVINPSIMKAYVICKNASDLRRLETYCNYCKNKTDGICTCDGDAANEVVPKAEAIQRSVAEKLLRDKQMRKNALFSKNNTDMDILIKLGNEANDCMSMRQSYSEMNIYYSWEDIALMPTCLRDRQQEAEFRRAVEGGEGDIAAGIQANMEGPLSHASTWRYERSRPQLADVSGTLHWAPDRRCRLLDIEGAKEVPWSNHVVVCVLGEVTAPVGLAPLLLPLRNRLIELDQLCDVVVLGDADNLAAFEWTHVRNFRQVYFVRGSGMFTDHLVCCRVHTACAVAVLKVGKVSDTSSQGRGGSGRNESRGEAGEGGEKNSGGSSGGGDNSTSGGHQSELRGQEAFDLVDTDAIVCAENVRAVVIGRQGEWYYREKFHLTVRLSSPEVASFFSDLKERDRDYQDSDVIRTQAFAEGLVISDTQLATLVSATFHCPEVAQFLQALIQGSNQAMVDNFVGSHAGMPSELDVECAALLSRSYPFRISQLSIRDAPLNRMFDTFNSKTIYWEDLYISSLEQFGIICLGIYQLRNKSRLMAKKKKPTGRFVFTFPPRRTIVDVSDKVFCIVPESTIKADNESGRSEPESDLKRVKKMVDSPLDESSIKSTENERLNLNYANSGPSNFSKPEVVEVFKPNDSFFNFISPYDSDEESV